MGLDKYAVIILAAGYSSRMGKFKPLLPIDDETPVSMISKAFKKLGIDKIVGVSGFQCQLLKGSFDENEIIEAYNADFDTGMFSSIKTGIKKADQLWGKDLSGYFLMLVDSPLVTIKTIKEIVIEQQKSQDSFIVPCYKGKKGHPLFIPYCLTEEILKYNGDGGLKAITSKYEEKLKKIELESESVVIDIDTEEGYLEVLKYYRENISEYKEATFVSSPKEVKTLKEYLQGKKIFLIRHGKIRQHKEKIFLGQTDVPLSEEGKAQAVVAAENLIKMGCCPAKIYSSDLSRTLETAEIIKESFEKKQNKQMAENETCDGKNNKNSKSKNDKIETYKKIEIIKEEKLREMSLGEWDGRFIREIAEKYPEEYKKRGENLLTYKYGNDSENFYDLQYRVMKRFEEIVKEDKNEEIFIVAHAGVISVIMANLEGKPLEEFIKNPIPNGGVVVKEF